MKEIRSKYFIVTVCLFFFTGLLEAQLCNNNLGDPIVNVTFGTKTNPEIPTGTGFTYVQGCPSKGQFTINDFLFGCGGSWVAMTGDHTINDPANDGNYMLIDAESTPGIIHQDTASGLCENMTYQFSAFITNVLRDNLSCSTTPILPNITFNIESLSGKILATYNTGDIAITNEKQWKQYGLTYKTTAGVNAVVLKVFTNPAYGCGSAFAIDDIVFQNCGPTVGATINGSTNPQYVCDDYTNPFVLQGTYLTGFTNPVVQWQSSADAGKTWVDISGATNTTYTVPKLPAGVIEYRMVVAEKANINSVNCRIVSNAIFIEVYEAPTHNPLQYLGTCSEKDFTLPPVDSRAASIQWTGPNGYSYTDLYSPAIIQNVVYADSGFYILNQTFFNGCTAKDSVYLNVFPGITLSAQPTYPVCLGTSENLLVTASGSATFKWSPSAGLSDDAIANPVATPQDSTVYKVIGTTPGGCQDSAFLPVDIYKPPVISGGEDKTILAGDTAILNGFVKGTSINYYWSPPSFINDVNAIQPGVYPTQDITYTLNAVSTLGCGSATDDVSVTIFRGFFIPNSFTPNGDGLNDKFRIRAYDNYKVLKFVIYNRWGQIVYTSNNATDGWDGNYKSFPQLPGAYVYNLELQNSNGQKTVKQGTLQLLR